MKHILLSLSFSAAALVVSAQQLQSSAFSELQTIIHNPGFAGTGKNNFLGVNYRTQWTDLKNAPKTATVFGSFALPKENLGIGGNIFSDKTGVTTRTGIAISVAKHINFNDHSQLSLGLENRFQQTSFDQVKLSQSLGSDPAISNTDNLFNYDAGFGALYTGKNLQVGISAAQLLQSEQKNYSGSLVRSQEARLYRHFYMNGSYKISVDETSTFIPYMLLIYLPNAPFEYWVGGKYKFDELFTVGGAFSKKKNVNLTFGINILKNVGLDYSFAIYNNPFDNLDEMKFSTHEFMIRYNLKGK